jgi:hypothetical protein
MASFDVAVGMTQNGLNSTLSNLFANPVAKAMIFTQTVKKTIKGIDVDLTVTIQASPTVVLSPPTEQQWQGSYGPNGTQETGTPPTNNVFQVIISAFNVKGTIAGVDVDGTEGIQVYAQLSLVNQILSVSALSVWIDESTWDKHGITKFIVNGVIIPYAIDTINNILNAIPFPQIPPDFTSQKFQNSIMQIVNNNELVVATAVEGAPQPDLSGYVPPLSEDVYLQAGIIFINNVLAEKLYKFPFDETASTGDSTAKASAHIQGEIIRAIGLIEGPSDIAVAIDADNITCYGELSGIATAVAKTVLCPVGTAIDAISDPDNWDKVVATFGVQYEPVPLIIPLTVNVTKEEDAGYVELSIGDINYVKIIAQPKWSGVIGSTLAAMAAGFVDFISGTFQTNIINKIIKDQAQHVKVWKNPSVDKTIQGIKITLSAEEGAALVPQAPGLIVEGFKIAFS